MVRVRWRQLALLCLVAAGCGRPGSETKLAPNAPTSASSRPAPPSQEKSEGVPARVPLDLKVIPRDAVMAPTVRVTSETVVLDGQLIVPLHEGRLDSAHLDGHTVTSLHAPLKRHTKTLRADPERYNDAELVQLAFDGGLPYRTVVDILYTAAKAEKRQQYLVVAAADGTGLLGLASPLANSSDRISVALHGSDATTAAITYAAGGADKWKRSAALAEVGDALDALFQEHPALGQAAAGPSEADATQPLDQASVDQPTTFMLPTRPHFAVSAASDVPFQKVIDAIVAIHLAFPVRQGEHAMAPSISLEAGDHTH